MTADCVGLFHPGPTWRVSSSDTAAVRTVADLLGGQAAPCPGGDGWQVETGARSVEITLVEVGTWQMAFRLHAQPRACWQYRSEGWELKEIIGGASLLAAGTGPVRLALVQVIVTTLTSRYVRYHRPVLEPA